MLITIIYYVAGATQRNDGRQRNDDAVYVIAGIAAVEIDYNVAVLV